MNYSPADILSRLLILMGVAVDPSDSHAIWPVSVGREPDSPDDVITIYNTQGIDHGRSGVDSERVEHHGVQVRLRSKFQIDGYNKARVIADRLDKEIYANGVTIIAPNLSTYLVHSFNRTSQVLSIGKETPSSKRSIHTFNGLLAIRKVA